MSVVDAIKKQALHMVRTDEVEKAKAAFNKLSSEDNKFFTDIARPGCNLFFVTDDFKKGETKHPSYLFCCELMDFCSFYYQTWFYYVCTVVGLLFVIGITVGITLGVVICYKKKRVGGRSGGINGKARKPGGLDEEAIESIESN